MNHFSDFSNFLGHTNGNAGFMSAHLVEIQLHHLSCETVQATYLCCEVFAYLNVASTVTIATWLSNYASSVLAKTTCIYQCWVRDQSKFTVWTHSLATSEEARSNWIPRFRFLLT